MATKKSAASSGGSKKSGGSKAGSTGGSKGGAFMAPLQPDDQLAAIVGKEPLPRTEVTKRVWDYIKQNNLQDANDKRTIKADAKLRPIFGGRDSVTMFEMTKLVNGHLKK